MAPRDRLASIDLHVHSPAGGDYRGNASTTAAQIVSACADARLNLAVIADHMTVDAWEAFAPLSGDGDTAPCLLPGAEIKVGFGTSQLHLVAIFNPENASSDFDALLRGLLPFVRKNGSLSTTEIGADPAVVAGMVQAAGGLCVAAHIDRHAGGLASFDVTWQRVCGLAEARLIDAIEFDDPARAETCLGRVNVSVVTSSDAHSLEEIGRRCTEMAMREVSFAGLRRALLAGRHSVIAAHASATASAASPR